MVLPPASHMLLTRNLLYTGITRAKRKLILLGESDAFSYSVHHEEEKMRKTDFCSKLKKELYIFAKNEENKIV